MLKAKPPGENNPALLYFLRDIGSEWSFASNWHGGRWDPHKRYTAQ